ncbi:MAG: hypothetical protein SWX82_28280 [Cyanobacteriota bacterium]|nr:hypothetical protein [Cyanobacteriota bacterium]
MILFFIIGDVYLIGPTPPLPYSPTLNYIISIQPDLILGVGTLADLQTC